jgi:hypothetical protein
MPRPKPDFPYNVFVFPLPLGPTNNTVPFYPKIKFLIIGETSFEKNKSYLYNSLYTQSKWKALLFNPFLELTDLFKLN